MAVSQGIADRATAALSELVGGDTAETLLESGAGASQGAVGVALGGAVGNHSAESPGGAVEGAVENTVALSGHAETISQEVRFAVTALNPAPTCLKQDEVTAEGTHNMQCKNCQISRIAAKL